MTENKMTIIIDKPIAELFEFSIDPANTPRWISDIEIEETNEWPVKLGTIYRNKGLDGIWNTYELTELNPPQSFTLTSKDSDFAVRYTFKELSDQSTEFEYYEWSNDGSFDAFTFDHLEKFKEIAKK